MPQRTDLFRPPDGILSAIDQAVPDDGSVALRIPSGLGHVEAAPEVVTTAHRLLTEALTNVRRHAPNATEVTVTAELDGPWLVLEVDNDAAERPGAGGYGLVGMAERVAAVGGTVRVGPEQGQRWRVTARLPLRPETG